VLGALLLCQVTRMCRYMHLQVKHAVLLSATEAAEMILRVDEIIKCKPC
jgi:hypothetical protein